MAYDFDPVTGVISSVAAETVAVDGKTLVIDAVTFSSTKTGGGHLVLTDVDGNIFVDLWGAKNDVKVLPFPKPRKLNGLIVATCDSGKVMIYLAQ